MEEEQIESTWSKSSEEVLAKCFPLHRACRDGDVQQLGCLLSSEEYDIYQEDDFYGWTPIHWAAYFGKLSCLLLLHDNDVCIDATTERLNQSPAHIVAYGGHATCLKWLLQHGSLINRQLACLRRLINTIETSGINGCDMVSSRFSQTPSHLCAYAGHPQCLYWLIQSRCNLNKQDYMGETPIHKAARTGSMECISLLVSQGASLSIKNYSGHNASQIARQASHGECANYLDRALQLQLQTKDSDQTRGSPDGQPATHNHFISNNTYHSNPFVNTHANPAILTNGQGHDNNNQSEDCDMEMDDGNGGSNMDASGDVLLDQGVTRNVVPVAGIKRGREEAEVECFKRARNDDYVFMNGSNGIIPHQNGETADPMVRNCKLNGGSQNNSDITHDLTNQNSITSHMTLLSHGLTNEDLVSSTMPNQNGSTFHETSNQLLHSNHMTHLTHELTNQQLVPNHTTQVSESMVEHSTVITMQQGYDSLMLDSLISELHGN